MRTGKSIELRNFHPFSPKLSQNLLLLAKKIEKEVIMLSKSRANTFSYQFWKSDSLKKQILSHSTTLATNFLNQQLEKAKVLQWSKSTPMPKVRSIEPQNSLGVGFAQDMIIKRKEQLDFLSSTNPMQNPLIKKMLLNSIPCRLVYHKLKPFEISKIIDAEVLFDSNNRFRLIPFGSICRDRVISDQQRLFKTCLEKFSLDFLKKVMYKEINQKHIYTQNVNNSILKTF